MEKHIDFELPSFARQTFPKDDYEIIIVDDLPENRQGQIEKFAKETGINVKWMRSKKPYYRSNANIGCARNTGLIHAQGELVIFIDDYSCIRPEYLECMWVAYKENIGYSPVGPVISVEPCDPPYPAIDDMKIHNQDMRVRTPGKDGNKRLEVFECQSNWFHTSNASAPMRKIININGFLELADITREEDVMFGMALAKNGGKLCYVNSPQTAVYHMLHTEEVNRKYREPTYKELGWETVKIRDRIVEGGGDGGWCGMQTEEDEIQRITKDVFNTAYPGSWGLIEFIRNNPLYKFNMETGFDLAKERKKVGNWT